MDALIALVQGKKNRQPVRAILLHAIDTLFHPSYFYDDFIVSLSPGKCNCLCYTVKLVLGWVIDTVAMTIRLPEQRQIWLGIILASLPPTRKRIGLTKYHKTLCELRSISLAFSSARNMFSAMYDALTNRRKRCTPID